MKRKDNNYWWTKILLELMILIELLYQSYGYHSSLPSFPFKKVQHPILQKSIEELQPTFQEIDLKTMSSLKKILDLYKKEQVSSFDFHGVNGYGHGDIGREKFDSVISQLMGGEKALVRLQFFSGTHAISTALFGCLRPGDEFLSVSGQPYDTLEEVIGLRVNEQTAGLTGSLKDWGIHYHQLDLQIHPDFSNNKNNILDNSSPLVDFDYAKIKEKLDANPKIKLIHVQRSCGYQWRPSIQISQLQKLVEFIRKEYSERKELILFCDNCYGELVEDQEPCHIGFDLVAGSLIKNLGGTLAPCGGYIVGKEKLVAASAVHLSAPGVDGGATLQQYRHLFQGLFMAPSIIGESLKGSTLLSTVLGKYLSFPCNPPPIQMGSSYDRTDIIQAIRLGRRDRVLAFCEAVQRNSPIGSFIRPVPGMTAGYGDEVIFADGTFIDGSTLELSADGPLREPFVVYSQGCVHWTHWALILDDLLTNSPAFQQPDEDR